MYIFINPFKPVKPINFLGAIPHLLALDDARRAPGCSVLDVAAHGGGGEEGKVGGGGTEEDAEDLDLLIR